MTEQLVRVETRAADLEGNLAVPEGAEGIVVFAHGSGSSRHSPRNQYVAQQLQAGNLATLLFDLLTEDEERVDVVTRHLRFDIGLLAQRMVDATDWLGAQSETADLAIGHFGSSTGAAAALVAAARRPEAVQAVVSRGGRADLAGSALAKVQAPTLLIVGENDPVVLQLNREAMRVMPGNVSLATIPGATHLFEEPGTLEQVATLARDWFVDYLSGGER